MTKEEFTQKYPNGMLFNILGTVYILNYDDKRCDQQDANGLCEVYSKEILLSLDGYEDDNAFKNIEEYYKKVLRHELIHAFLHEMGLRKYFEDETLVDALAIKMPQIMELMEEFV